MVMLSDDEIKHIYAEAYRQGRIACKKGYQRYYNPHMIFTKNHRAWDFGWKDYRKEHEKERIHEN